jgi:5-methyltetrahydropteroyltriglutamate--homocysteine methyltransferase
MKPLNEFKEAKELGVPARPVLLGPVSFLALGKSVSETPFDSMTLLDSLLPVYVQLLQALQAEGAEWVQIDEPILALDRPASWKKYFTLAYET